MRAIFRKKTHTYKIKNLPPDNHTFQDLYNMDLQAREELFEYLNAIAEEKLIETEELKRCPEDLDLVIGNGGFMTAYFIGTV